MTKDRHCPLVNLHASSPNAMRLNRLMRMSRRDTLMTGMAGMGVLAVGNAVAADPTTSTDPELERFMTVSARLTDRASLDPRISQALYERILQSGPERKAQLSKLAALLESGTYENASAFAKAAEQADPVFKDVIHDIMTGWYRGVADGKVVVYRSALMFDVTKDAIYPKTYAAGGPFYWTTQPPEVDKPTGAPALSPSKFDVEPT
ncbi:sorbitol dehydrogenase family protein [Gluconobacter albidus]|uniref:sorbitol dehydrogenase family protein n=1 Tax=Gluconobacter albidus TaxID=318683 RepID=UPI0020A22077|nr:sorbitol dehydrogenase family protein [Gluconobacter albidus]MCP1272892.1 sorbitol dehydrogenase family protein [Gluconobacter albidus]